MPRAFLLLSVVLFGGFVHAMTTATDLSVQASYRSLPLGGGIGATGATSVLTWGDLETPWYGFARAGVDFNTALSYNAGAGFLEIFPVSFLALKTGRELSSNAKEYDGFDCALSDCTGARRQDFLEARLAFPAGKAFVVLKERAEWHSRDGTDSRRFAEPTSGLLLDSGGGERLRVSQIVVGAPINERANLLVGQVRYEATGRTSQSFVAGTYRMEEFSVFAGIGYWRGVAAAVEPRMNFLLQGSWAPVKGWALF